MMDNILDEILAVERLLDPYPSADREFVIAQKCLSAGRREVVEWVEDNAYPPAAFRNIRRFRYDDWQAQKKEWGLDD